MIYKQDGSGNDYLAGMDQEEMKKLLEAVKTVLAFVEDIPGGESYWIDFEGESHTADMGYVFEFLDDLEAYMQSQQLHGL